MTDSAEAARLYLAQLDRAEGQRAEAELKMLRWADRRDDMIRELIADNVPVREIVSATGLSRARVYQIRDRRR